jgi:hypothetical protein
LEDSDLSWTKREEIGFEHAPNGTLLTIAAFTCALMAMVESIWLHMVAFTGAVIVGDAPEESS